MIKMTVKSIYEKTFKNLVLTNKNDGLETCYIALGTRVLVRLDKAFLKIPE